MRCLGRDRHAKGWVQDLLFGWMPDQVCGCINSHRLFSHKLNQSSDTSPDMNQLHG